MIIRGERTCLETTVKSQNTERIGVGVGQVEVFGAQIGGVGASPDGIVVAARGTHADVVAHDVGVGAGIPTETETPQEGVDTTKAKTTGRCREIVVEEKAAGVGIKCEGIFSSGKAGCSYVIMNRIGTNYAVEGVDIMGVGLAGNSNEITLAGVALVELIGTSLRYRVPEEFAHVVVNYNGMYEPELKRILSGEGETQQHGEYEQFVLHDCWVIMKSEVCTWFSSQ